MIIQIAAQALKEIEATVGSLPAEECGWLGAAPGEYITHYFFDQAGERGRQHITLGPYLRERLYEKWPPNKSSVSYIVIHTNTIVHLRILNTKSPPLHRETSTH